MKKENDIYNEYIKYNPNKPMFIGKEYHWKTFYEGYEAGHQDAIEERDEAWSKELGLDVENFPLLIDEAYDVIKQALKDFYQNQKK